MKTDDLIRTLAAEPATPAGLSVDVRALLGTVGGLILTLALFVTALGPRPGLWQAWADPLVLAKSVLPLVLGLLALALALRAVRPGRAAGAPGRAIAVVPVAAAGLFLFAFATAAPGTRMALFLGHSIPVCLPAIVILSLPVLAGLLSALKRGAPVRPALAGALAGLAAGGLAATVYSTFCTEDSPLFYAVWYALGITLAALAGALAGRRLLAW
ncbi:NrsF family protein [Salipiger sp.]|uniref:NrsF family protein n=1 Tax=Salipiger sp. TaxID=2078585 RepID=UPI003A96D370